MGAAFASPRVGRGAAYADIYNDGRLDILMSTNGGPAVLFRNEATGEAVNRSLRMKLVGTKSNRDGIGATAHVTTADGTQTEMMRSGSSYLSASELVLTFGLGKQDKAGQTSGGNRQRFEFGLRFKRARLCFPVVATR